MNDIGALFLVGILSFLLMILIIVFKKVQDTYGAKKAFRYFGLTFISILILAVFIWLVSMNQYVGCGCDNIDDLYILAENDTLLQLKMTQSNHR